MLKRILLNCIFTFFTLQLFAQNINVQAFTYESTTRDSMIAFPDVDHNDYEKIWMYYSMRCKDGLTSSGANPNLGCGEWDYSCNTSIIDSTRLDSLYSISPSHVISNFSGDLFEYTNQATQTYLQATQYDVSNGNILTENTATIGTGILSDNQTLAANNLARSQFLYTAEAMASNGLQAGNISGLQLNIEAAASTYKNFRIRIKSTNKDRLSKSNTDNHNFYEVYFLDTNLDAGIQTFDFYRTFFWDGNANLILEITYEHETTPDAVLLSTEQSDVSSLHFNTQDDYQLEVQGSGYVDIPHEFSEISDEITISLWTKGASSLPVNTTVFEGLDANNQRQVNVHLPWGNGQVYWDCGNVGGYDRINKSAELLNFKDRWNHWAFTKNAATGSMKIYLNGTLFHSGTGKTKPIDLRSLRLGRSINGLVNYFGKLDEFRVWNKELSEADIKAWMHQQVTSEHPNYENLVCYYQLNDPTATTIQDASPYARNGEVVGPVSFRAWKATELVTTIQESNKLPNLTFLQNTYSDSDITVITTLDSLQNSPNQVDTYTVEGTDLTLVETDLFYQAGYMPVFNEAGELVDSVFVNPENNIAITELEHYAKQPSKVELMSFVTPYGINLDMGIEGKTWLFDVTDFGPVLKGNKRLLMDRGGQWQEDIDIRFVYVEGTPSRDVLEMQQVWAVTSENYGRINDDFRFEPIQMPFLAEASSYVLKAAITGHGQEGEFIPRTHYLNVDGGIKEYEWQVWKECSENPVYPQGGTWIYDRAGWCPGMATDVQRVDITPFVTPGESTELDYGMEVATGDSRYIVNIQMVTYGEANFTQDAELVDIINPTSNIEHGRYNPICGKPSIKIRNNGSSNLTSVDIEYGINGAYDHSYTWTGNLAYLEETEVTLNQLSLSAITMDEAMFNVRLTKSNGSLDAYDNNNSLSTPFEIVPQRSNGVVIQLRTNNFSLETSWRLLDSEGNIVESLNVWGLSSNTTYIDTISNLSGCYRLIVEDSDDDGISFWANNDGNGNVAISNLTSLPINVWDAVGTDFGGFVIYEFVAGEITPTEDLGDIRLLEVFPNPSNGRFQVDLGGFEETVQLRVHNSIGQLVQQQTVSNAYRTTSTFVDLSDFEDGMYYLEVLEKDKVYVEKLVKYSSGF